MLVTFLVEFEVEISDEAERWVLNPGEENPFESPESFDSFDTGFFTIEPCLRTVTNERNEADHYHYTEYWVANSIFLTHDQDSKDKDLRAEIVSMTMEQHQKALLMSDDDEAIVAVSVLAAGR